MFSSDEVGQTTDALERLPRSIDRRTVLSERRQVLLQQKFAERETDALPPLIPETPNPKVARRQLVQLREENKRLRFEVEAQRMDLERLRTEKEQFQRTLEHETAAIHNGYQQEIALQQYHVQELMKERNQLYEANRLWEQRYEELMQTVQPQDLEQQQLQTVDQSDPAYTVTRVLPESVLPLVPVTQTQMHPDTEHYVAEALQMKRNMQYIAQDLEEQRKQLNIERQQFHEFHYNMLEQLKTRQDTLRARLYDRWRLVSLGTSLGLLACLVVLQFVFLAFSSIAVTTHIAFVLIVPIVLCVLGAFVAATPLKWLRQVYLSAPRRKKTGLL